MSEFEAGKARIVQQIIETTHGTSGSPFPGLTRLGIIGRGFHAAALAWEQKNFFTAGPTQDTNRNIPRGSVSYQDIERCPDCILDEPRQLDLPVVDWRARGYDGYEWRVLKTDTGSSSKVGDPAIFLMNKKAPRARGSAPNQARRDI